MTDLQRWSDFEQDATRTLATADAFARRDSEIRGEHLIAALRTMAEPPVDIAVLLGPGLEQLPLPPVTADDPDRVELHPIPLAPCIRRQLDTWSVPAVPITLELVLYAAFCDPGPQPLWVHDRRAYALPRLRVLTGHDRASDRLVVAAELARAALAQRVRNVTAGRRWLGRVVSLGSRLRGWLRAVSRPAAAAAVFGALLPGIVLNAGLRITIAALGGIAVRPRSIYLGAGRDYDVDGTLSARQAGRLSLLPYAACFAAGLTVVFSMLVSFRVSGTLPLRTAWIEPSMLRSDEGILALLLIESPRAAGVPVLWLGVAALAFGTPPLQELRRYRSASAIGRPARPLRAILLSPLYLVAWTAEIIGAALGWFGLPAVAGSAVAVLMALVVAAPAAQGLLAALGW